MAKTETNMVELWTGDGTMHGLRQNAILNRLQLILLGITLSQ